MVRVHVRVSARRQWIDNFFDGFIAHNTSVLEDFERFLAWNSGPKSSLHGIWWMKRFAKISLHIHNGVFMVSVSTRRPIKRLLLRESR